MPLDLSGPLKSTIDVRLAEAQQQEEAGNLGRAASLYRQATALVRQYAQVAMSPDLREQRLHAASTYEQKAQQLNAGKSSFKSSATQAQGELEGEGLREEILGLITRSPATWDDIGGLDATKREIRFAYAVQFAGKPEGFQHQAWKTMMLYGPPGTGKTLLAAATSNGLQTTFFDVPIGSVLSKYFGESSRLISALYDTAREMAPSVIFLDEIEALGAQRGGDESGAERRVVDSFLSELDGLKGKGAEEYILTITSTNLPWLLDKALLSRFETRIYVPPPDKEARKSILRIHLQQQGVPVEVAEEELAEMTEGYSGRELARICKEAVNGMVMEMNEKLLVMVDQSPEVLKGYTLQLRPVTKADFQEILARTPREISPQDLRRYEEWGHSH